jgi:5-methylcytosine-specific restriction endonuclease McrA
MNDRCKYCQNDSQKKYYANNKEKFKINTLNRLARKKLLINDFTFEECEDIINTFGGCALTGSSDNLHLDHVIPLASGHGGTTYGNMIPLRGDLNISKNDRNIFEWFEGNRQRFELSQEKFDRLVEWLASANAMTVEEYRTYVYWCHDNPRIISGINESGAI